MPLDCGKAEKKTHDYVRHGTANLFAALDVETGEVFGECRPTRTGQDFLDFLNKAVQLHVDKEIHVVLDVSTRKSCVARVTVSGSRGGVTRRVGCVICGA